MNDEPQTLHWQAVVRRRRDSLHLVLDIDSAVHADGPIDADGAYTTSRKWLDEKRNIFEVTDSYLPSDGDLAESDTEYEDGDKIGYVILRRDGSAIIINYRTNTRHLVGVGDAS